jgi:6-methylsalicylate decarboxylase
MTIDTHHHVLPDFFWQATENAHAPVGGLAPLRWSKEASISFMDDAGIDLAVVSMSTPGVHTGDSAKARNLARRCNEFSAELVHSRPDRFRGFRLPPLAGCRCLFRGTLLRTRRPRAPRLGSLYEFQRRVPRRPCPGAGFRRTGAPQNRRLCASQSFTGRGSALFRTPGQSARLPDRHQSRRRADALHEQIRAHAKREVHLLPRRRLDTLSRRTLRDHRRDGVHPGGEQRGTAADMFRRILLGHRAAVSDPVLRMLRDVAGIDQVVYGTDFPYLRRDLANSRQRILESSALNESERRAILGGNASQLFEGRVQCHPGR